MKQRVERFPSSVIHEKIQTHESVQVWDLYKGGDVYAEDQVDSFL